MMGRCRVFHCGGGRRWCDKAHCGPGDLGEPVTTIMLPDED